MASPDGKTIQGRTLFKGGHYRIEKGFDRGHYRLEKGFDRGHYSREDIN